MRYKKEEMEIYRLVPDGHKSLAYAYDADTRLYLRQQDQGLIMLVKFSEFERIVKELADGKDKESN